MLINAIRYINLLLFILIMLCFAGGAYIVSLHSKEITQPDILPPQSKIPKNSFSLKESNYQEFMPLKLNSQLPHMLLPDLRQNLQFYGKNPRPDANSTTNLFFSLNNGLDVDIIQSGKPYYLTYNAPHFKLSSENQATELWLKVEALGNQAKISLRAKDDQGEIIAYPKERAEFTLVEKPLKGDTSAWMIGDLRADATLLSRLHARWSGRDLFLEDQGGIEYLRDQGKQRIVFGEEYSLYVDKGDLIVWQDKRWQVVKAGDSTQGLPLMKVEKVEPKLMNFVLFHPEGKQKIPLILIKHSENTPIFYPEDFKFVGARTKLHSIFKIDETKREIVSPSDWFILTSEGWKKIKTHKEIDQYVEGSYRGNLLVIDRIGIQANIPVLEATLYNSSRSESIKVDLLLRLSEKKAQNEQVKRQEDGSQEIESPQISE